MATDVFNNPDEILRFFSVVLHELHHPLVATVSAAALASEYKRRNEIDDRWTMHVRHACDFAESLLFNANYVVRHSLGYPIEPRIEKLVGQEILVVIRKLISASELFQRHRELTLKVDLDSLVIPNGTYLTADGHLIRHALWNVMRNALEYSFEHTEIRVHGKVIPSKSFVIRTSNKGFEMTHDDIRHCIEFGWQSDKAQQVNRGGLGIGLWITKGIIDAHGGTFSITSSDGVTLVDLVLPLITEKGKRV